MSNIQKSKKELNKEEREFTELNNNKLKRFEVVVDEDQRNILSFTITAKSKKEALEKAMNWDYVDLDSEEVDSSVDWNNAEIEEYEDHTLDDVEESFKRDKADKLNKEGETNG